MNLKISWFVSNFEMLPMSASFLLLAVMLHGIWKEKKRKLKTWPETQFHTFTAVPCLGVLTSTSQLLLGEGQNVQYLGLAEVLMLI